MRGETTKARVMVHLPFASVLFVVLIAMSRIAAQHWREGGLLIGGALLLAVLLRAMLPAQRLGLLVIRSRVVDMLLYGGLGLVLIAVAATIKP